MIIIKKFKSKKKNNYFFIYFAIFLVSMAISVRYLYKNNRINDDTLVSILVNDNLSSNSNITSVDFLLKYALNIELDNNKLVTNNEEVKEKVEVVKNENNKELIPLVYIYNTHQEEKYNNSYVSSYNVAPSVLLASKILKEYLEKLGIGVIVEEESISEKLNLFNWSYGKSYKVSRMLIENAKNNYPNLKYYIDIHRDSSSYNATTTTIDNEVYAKLLFVVGLDNPNYENNLNKTERLRNKIVEYNSNLDRGIMKKSGKGVNGVYNQDFDSNTFLIEVGGQYNSINEVNNTLEVFANLLYEYIKEEENE